MHWPRHFLSGALSELQLKRIEDSVMASFSRIGGGTITAGDATVIASVMEMVRPTEMIEISVASGFSSAFILTHARRSGLLGNDVFLHSVDIAAEYKPGVAVGRYVPMHFPELQKNWSLNTGPTSATMLEGRFKLSLKGDGPIVGFIDGGHEQPWPLLDLIYLYKTLPRGSWIVMQDIQMMERWIADCIVLNHPCPTPVRGVNYVASHWPGTKFLGFDTAFNSAAICLDIPEWQFRGFVQETRRYPFETSFDYGHLFDMVG